MKEALTRRLVALGAAQDERAAAALVMAGQVYVAGQRARAGQRVAPDQDIAVRGLRERYVAKGGLKLEGALACFGVDVRGRVCIDAGASTGGFTDCLVQHGARLVYAVDVGYGQLMGSLRQDERVVNLERTNISDPSLLRLSPAPTLGTVDLSYLSLRQALPQFIAILQGRGELICLVKPLFETEDPVARREGRLADGQYAPVLNDLIGFVSSLPGAQAAGLCHSPVTGNAGSREFFLHVRLGQAGPGAVGRAQVEEAVGRALALTPYRKSGISPLE